LEKLDSLTRIEITYPNDIEDNAYEYTIGYFAIKYKTTERNAERDAFIPNVLL
jgi:hypothetical protein